LPIITTTVHNEPDFRKVQAGYYSNLTLDG